VSFRHARLAGGPRTCVGLSLSGCAGQATLHVLPGRCSIPDGRAGGEWPQIFGAPWAIRWRAHSSSAQPNLGRASAAPGAVPVWVENPLALPICAAPRIVPFILRPRWGRRPCEECAARRAGQTQSRHRRNRCRSRGRRCWPRLSTHWVPDPIAVCVPVWRLVMEMRRHRAHAGRKNCGNGPPMGYAALPWRVNWRTGSA